MSSALEYQPSPSLPDPERNGGEGSIFEAIVWTIVPWFVDPPLRSDNDGEEREDEFSSGMPAVSVAP
ncbi:hypothetical protein GCM10027567_14210 [Spongiibacter taiwanensis]